MTSPLSFSCTTSPVKKEKHELLYEESLERKMRKEVIYHNICSTDCTFHPKLISKRPSCKSQLEYKTAKGIKNVIDCEPPTRKKKISLGSIVRLHTMAKDIWERRRVLSEQSRVSSPSISQQSIAITEKRKNLSFEHIFEILDSDEDGVISSDLIDC